VTIISTPLHSTMVKILELSTISMALDNFICPGFIRRIPSCLSTL